MNRGARWEAAQRGDPTYVTGRPCPRDHRGDRYTKTGVCIECNRARLRRWNEANRERVDGKWAQWNALNPDARVVARREWARRNPEYNRRQAGARQRRLKDAMPAWADRAAIEDFYGACPDGWQVDHAVPIKHSRVCGLHCPANLQYLPAAENRSKGNEFIAGAVDMLTFTPWRADGNLGRAYNETMEQSVRDGEWACFRDHDAMTLTNKWHSQLLEAIAFKPDAGAFVAMTNRIASPWQRCGDPESNDLAWHQKFAESRTKVRTLLDITDTKGFGGVMFAVSKESWRLAGGFAEGLGCVDHSLHFRLRDAGKRIYLIEGLYLFHWRHFGQQDPTSIFPKAEGCQCRGAEIMPTARIEIPVLTR